MKIQLASHRNHGLTLVEVVIILLCLTFLVVLILPAVFQSHHTGAQRLGCVNNLKQIGLAHRVWAGDNNNKYPMDVSVTNGGTRELIATGNVLSVYLCMSNELSTAKILHCPQDREHKWAVNFDAALSASNLSYFIGPDVNESESQAIFSGDSNLQLAGTLLKPGLTTLTTSSDVTWDSTRHLTEKNHFWNSQHPQGNIGLADGSAAQLGNAGLKLAIGSTGLATNRIAIP